MTSQIAHSRPRDEIAERIECFIIEKQLKPGERLPSERELCEAWNCNRMTFRAAVKRLIAEGTLYNIPATGTYVAYPKLERYLQDLTSFSDFVTQKGRASRSRLISAATLTATPKMAERLQAPAGSPVFELVRLRLVDDCPMSLETAYIPVTRFPGIAGYDFERQSLYGVMQAGYGTVFSGGREEISLTYADAREAALMGVQEGDALFFLKGITWDANRLPVEYIKSVSRTDKMSFAGTLIR